MADTPPDPGPSGTSAKPAVKEQSVLKMPVVAAPKRPSTRASIARQGQFPDLYDDSPVLILPIVKAKAPPGPPRKVGRPRKTQPVPEATVGAPIEAEPEPAEMSIPEAEPSSKTDVRVMEEAPKTPPVNTGTKITTITSTKTVVPTVKKAPAKFPAAPSRAPVVLAPPSSSSSSKLVPSSAPIPLTTAPKKYTSIVNTIVPPSISVTGSKIDKVPPGTAVSMKKSDFIPSVSREDDETLSPSKDLEFISVIIPPNREASLSPDKKDEYVIKKPPMVQKPQKSSGLLDNVDTTKVVTRPMSTPSTGCIVVPPNSFNSSMPAHVAAKLASPLGKTPGLIPLSSVGSVLSKFSNTCGGHGHDTGHGHALPSITVLTTPNPNPPLEKLPSPKSAPIPLVIASSLPHTLPEKDKTILIPPSPSSTISLSVPLTGSSLDETIEEVSKGHFRMRTLDSDSTLTASETEILEERLKNRVESPNSKKSAAKKKRPVAQLTSDNRGGALPLDRLVAISEEAKKRLKLDFAASNANKKMAAAAAAAAASTTTISAAKKPSSDIPVLTSSPVSKKEVPTPSTSKVAKQPLLSNFPLRISTEGVLMSAGPSGTMTASSLAGTPQPVDKRSMVREEASVETKAPPARAEIKKPFHFIKADFSDEDQNSMDAHGFDWTSPSRPGKEPATAKNSTVVSPSVADERNTARKARSLSISSDMTEETISMSVASTAMDYYEPRPVRHAVEKESTKKRKKTTIREAYKIGSAPLTDLGRWKPQDDMLLIVAVQEYRDLATVHKHVKFSCHFSAIEIQERWFNLLYNKKISKAACQAVRSSPSDIVADVQRKSPFSEAEEAVLAEIPLLSEFPELEVFELLLEANHNVFPPFRFAEDLEKHWRVMLAEGRIENCDNLCVVPDEQISYNGDRLPCFAEMEARIKDVDLKNWIHVTGEFAYEMDKIQRQNRERMHVLDAEINHLRFLLERTINYQLPDCGKPDFFSVHDRAFLAVLTGQRARFGIKSGRVSFGRSCGDHVVDVDMSLEGYAGKLSRTQGYIYLERNGSFRIENHGRRPVFVNQTILNYGDSCVLTDDSMLEVGDLCLQFYMNQMRIGRYLRQKYGSEYLSDEEPIEHQERDRRPKSTKVVRKHTKVPKHNTYEHTAALSEADVSDSGSMEKIDQEQTSTSNRSSKGRTTKKTGKSLLATVLSQESSAMESSSEASTSRKSPKNSKATPMEQQSSSQDEVSALPAVSHSQTETGPSAVTLAFSVLSGYGGPLPPAASLASRMMLESPESQMAALNAVNDLLQAQHSQMASQATLQQQRETNMEGSFPNSEPFSKEY